MVVRFLVVYTKTSIARIKSSSGISEDAVSFGTIEAAKVCDSQYVRSDLPCGGAENRADDLEGGVE